MVQNSADFCYFAKPFCHKLLLETLGVRVHLTKFEEVRGQRKVGSPCP